MTVVNPPLRFNRVFNTRNKSAASTKLSCSMDKWMIDAITHT